MEIVEGIKQAIEYSKNGDFKKAEKLYLSMLKKNQDNASLLSFLGLLYYERGLYEKSEKYLDKSYKLLPSDTIVFYIGMNKFYLEKYQTAIAFLEKSSKNNDTLEYYQAYLTSCSSVGEYKKGYDKALEAYKKYPFDKIIIKELAYLSIKRGQFKECEQYSKYLLQLDSKSSLAWHNLGLLQEVLYQDNAKAREYYRKMLHCGDKLEGYLDLAISYLKESDGRKKAYYYLKKIEKIAPDTKGLRFLLASYYLSNRQFKKGYAYYINPEFRTRESSDWYSKFKSMWRGEKQCKQDVLFIFGDQGIGDQIQYVRYLPYLSKKFRQIKVMVDSPLLDLFKYSYKDYKNIRFYSSTQKIPNYDKSTFLTFSPYYLGMKFNKIPSSSGYLDVESINVEKYQNKYFSNNKFKIGICWEAGATGLRDQIHRVLNIELYEKIINTKEAITYSFQVNPSMDNYKKYSKLIDLGSTFKDFSDTAAALKNLDVMITVDTSVAHLSGALGVKTILILPYCPDWRWFDNDEKTEWYNSVIIFKQQPNELWESVFERIKNYLDNTI